jgi:UDP-N-acetylmuramoyl-L-alanyl-D-glutamate--2,6-diaminopimelate ligase
MLRQIKRSIRGVLNAVFGEGLFMAYHYILAIIASQLYGNPSKKMLVIAVTGTKGKTSTLNFLWHVLTAGGYKVGMISTANIKIGTEEKMNWYHMTMPGRFLLQKLLKEMLDARCDIVVVEATSEGIKMNRHIGLYYDMAVFTNLFPEHLKSHNNSFEEYKKKKGLLFENLKKLPVKRWNGADLEKVSIVNVDDENGEYFLNFTADKKYSYGTKNGDYRFSDVRESVSGVDFSFEENVYSIPLLGVFNIYNAMPAILVGKQLEISVEKIEEGVQNCSVIPGRMEIINEGQNFTAIVDYAHEGVSMRAALEASKKALATPQNKLIAVYGAEGGGRDTKKRETMSKAVSELADFAIVTLSDPFDTDPQLINNDIVSWLEKFGFKKGENIFDYVDRREAIKKAVSLAQPGDVILFASKGAEQSIIFKDHTEEWDDRVEVRKAINPAYRTPEKHDE